MSDVLKLYVPDVGMLPLNIEYSSGLGLEFVRRGALADCPGAIVCGTGPTITKSLPEIRRLQKKGYKVFAVKQAIRILSENGIVVDYSVAMDPTQKQIKKTPLQTGVKYIVASSCHPAMFDYLLKNKMEVLLFHSLCGAEQEGLDEFDLYDKHFPDEDLFVAEGGYTVVNRAVAVAEFMGAKRIYIAGAPFGWREDTNYYEGSVKETAGNATGPTLDDKGLVDGQRWFTKADLLPSALSIAKKAKANPGKYYFLGDSLAASLAARTDDFLERVIPSKQ